MQTTVRGSAADHRTRVLALSGVAFAVILMAGVFSVPSPPQPGDSVESIRSYYVQHATGVRVYVLASAIAAAFLLVFVVTLCRALGDSAVAATVTLGAGVLALAATLAGAAGFGTLGQAGSDITEPGVVRALFDFSNMSLNVGDHMLALLVGVPSAVALQAGFLPKWLAYAGLALSAAWALAGAAIVVGSGPFAGPNGPYGLSVTIAFLVWVVCTSIILYRRWEPDA